MKNFKPIKTVLLAATLLGCTTTLNNHCFKCEDLTYGAQQRINQLRANEYVFPDEVIDTYVRIDGISKDKGRYAFYNDRNLRDLIDSLDVRGYSQTDINELKGVMAKEGSIIFRHSVFVGENFSSVLTRFRMVHAIDFLGRDERAILTRAYNEINSKDYEIDSRSVLKFYADLTSGDFKALEETLSYDHTNAYRLYLKLKDSVKD